MIVETLGYIFRCFFFAVVAVALKPLHDAK